MKTIAVTGTKGKTTLAILLDTVLRLKKYRTLLICSEGIFKNGKKAKGSKYFLKKHWTSPTVAAFAELSKKKIAEYSFIVLELSYASSKNIKGSVFENKFDISVLTNVYWDHIDGKRIRNRKELFEKKLAILENTKKNGNVFIYVGDRKENIAPKAITRLQKERPDIKITTYDNYNLCQESGFSHDKCFLKNDKIYLNKKELLDYSQIESTLKNINPATDLAIVALSGILEKVNINPQSICLLKKIDRLIPGRFNIFRKNNHVVILDYAHEIKSLSFSAKTLRTLFGGRKITAIVRLSYYRDDNYIKNLTKKMASLFDKYIIYDKASSRPAFRKIFTNRFYKRKAGDVAKLMYKIIKDNKKSVVIINNELTAIKKGIRDMKRKDILYIMGDQIEKDIQIINDCLRHRK